MISQAKAVISVLLFFMFILPFPSNLRSAEVSPGVRGEMDHLLGYVEKSGCRFNRNGTWYTDAKAVREHIETKYRYFVDRGKINSTEDFIKWCATKSEISGKPYQVKCSSGPEQPLGQWLTEELNRLRKTKSAGRQ